MVSVPSAVDAGLLTSKVTAQPVVWSTACTLLRSLPCTTALSIAYLSQMDDPEGLKQVTVCTFGLSQAFGTLP